MGCPPQVEGSHTNVTAEHTMHVQYRRRITPVPVVRRRARGSNDVILSPVCIHEWGCRVQPIGVVGGGGGLAAEGGVIPCMALDLATCRRRVQTSSSRRVMAARAPSLRTPHAGYAVVWL